MLMIAISGIYSCKNCGKTYKWLKGLRQHQKYDCGKPAKLQCPHCKYKCKFKFALKKHIFVKHQINNFSIPPMWH